MTNQQVPAGYIKDIIQPEDYIFGSGQLQGTILRPDGDWRDYLPKDEQQKMYGLETSACTVFHTLNPLEILLEEKYKIKDSNFSERHVGYLAGITPKGGSPHKVAEAIRKYGVIDENKLPFSPEINTWEEFYANPGFSLLLEGLQWSYRWNFGHDWVFEENAKVESKQDLLLETLKYSPIGVSVYAWMERNGVYFNDGFPDTHWTTLVYGKKGEYWIVRDSYFPFEKKLAWDFPFGMTKRYSIDVDPERAALIIHVLKRIIKLYV